jgi:hypothetical protein
MVVHRTGVRIASCLDFTEDALQLAVEFDLRGLFRELLNGLKRSPDDFAESLFGMEALIIAWRFGDLLEVGWKLLLCSRLFHSQARILLGED